MQKVNITVCHRLSKPADLQGLHSGHKAVVQHGKTFGDVTVHMCENLEGRNYYFRTGNSVGKYKIKSQILERDCQELGVTLQKPSFIEIPEGQRVVLYKRATEVAEEKARPVLIADRFVDQWKFSFMWYIWARPGASEKPDFDIFGPEPFLLFWIAVAKKVSVLSPKILYPKIVKDEYGFKAGIDWTGVSIDKTILRNEIGGWREKFLPGSNYRLVEEINSSYHNSDWKIKDIIVWEDDILVGKGHRLESIGILVNNSTRLIEEFDYC